MPMCADFPKRMSAKIRLYSYKPCGEGVRPRCVHEQRPLLLMGIFSISNLHAPSL